MADGSKIEWTNATWNIVTGCSVISPGCANCYAMKLAGTRLEHHSSRAGLTQPSNTGPVWTGEVRFNERWLREPLAWKRPRKIFVCAHGDLFHEEVPGGWLVTVFAVMAMARQHTFQVLTKRAERMRRFLEWLYTTEAGSDALSEEIERLGGTNMMGWIAPLPNVWCGVSAEDQKRADERLPHLRATPAAVRWVSAEPLLGAIRADLTGIDWLVAGGESGPGARPMHPSWARSLRDQCEAAGVAFFFKQHGEFVELDGILCQGGHGDRYDRGPGVSWLTSDGALIPLNDPRAGRCSVWGSDSIVLRVGKKSAGALLDGRLHREFPKVPA